MESSKDQNPAFLRVINSLKESYKILFLIIFLSQIAFPQSEVKLMSYNALNYPGSTANVRNPYFSTVISSTNPDILVMQEMTSQAGVNGFLANVLVPINSDYTAGQFIDGPDTDNSIFFKRSLFTFISNMAIATSLRNISEFKLVYTATNDTLRIYSVHLKASSGSSNEQQRLAEVTILRNITDALPVNSNYLICGDFNLYGSTEAAYQKLLNKTNHGYFVDLFNLTGTWNNSAYAQYHTQSPRTRQFGGGSNGGMDDRFDLILFSQALIDEGSITYVPGSYTAYGNDGLHYNDSINRPPNVAVGQVVADAIHYSSDHIPVLVSIKFEDALPVELGSFTDVVLDNDVLLKWNTITEINNYGFEIERKFQSDIWNSIGFILGNGSSNAIHHYEFKDEDLAPGNYQYRLKQLDLDGSSTFSNTISAQINNMDFHLSQNYPNPFNGSTVIGYYIPEKSFVDFRLYDCLGNTVAVLVNEEQEPGSYSVQISSTNLSSGIYFYRIVADGFASTKRLIVLK